MGGISVLVLLLMVMLFLGAVLFVGIMSLVVGTIFGILYLSGKKNNSQKKYQKVVAIVFLIVGAVCLVPLIGMTICGALL